MAKYVLEEGKGVVDEKREAIIPAAEERMRVEELKPKEVLSVLLKRGWTLPQMTEIKRKLSETGKQIWKPRIEAILQETGYAKRLKEEAARINLSEEVKKAWK
jgi:hypothetical protein